jgi:hypothetical protein
MRFRTGKGSDHLWLEGHGLDLENSHFLRLVKEQLGVEHLSGGDVSRNEKVFSIQACNFHSIRNTRCFTKTGSGQVSGTIKIQHFAPFIYKNEHFTKTGSGQT